MKDLLAKINLRRFLLYALYLFLVLVFQNMALTQIRPLGVCPFMLPAAVVAVSAAVAGAAGSAEAALAAADTAPAPAAVPVPAPAPVPAADGPDAAPRTSTAR